MAEAKRNDPNYGRGKAKIASGEVGVFAHELPELIIKTFQSPSYKPPVAPSVALELRRAVSKPDVQFADLEPLLRKDPMLAARVLRLAQSPQFAGRSRITSLKDAAVRLGLEQLAALFLEASMSAKQFVAPGFDQAMSELLEHSVAVARAARILAPQVKINTDHAFLCGLLHDIGFVAALIVLAEGQAKGTLPNVPLASSLPAVEAVHAQASGIIGKLWGLPPDVCLALENHHRFVLGNDVFRDGALLIVAESVAPPLKPPLHTPIPAATLVRAAMALGLDGGSVGTVQNRVRLKPPTRI
jgi:HD-like signal output (HDOD) protein